MPSPETRPWRDRVGGLWDEIGPLQLTLVQSAGVEPDARLLDAGCGCARGGIHLARWLTDGTYTGIDRDAELVEAARLELQQVGAHGTIIRGDLLDAETWTGVDYDTVLLQSVWTHLPLADVARTLAHIAATMARPGRLVATHFTPGTFGATPTADPFAQTHAELEALADEHGFAVEVASGDFGHPRGQRAQVWSLD